MMNLKSKVMTLGNRLSSRMNRRDAFIQAWIIVKAGGLELAVKGVTFGNRQEVQFQRIGIQISRQDMSNWQQQVYAKLKPLFVLLKETLKSGPVIQMDETTVQVMGEEGRADTQKSYMWLARGGPSRSLSCLLFPYSNERSFLVSASQ